MQKFEHDSLDDFCKLNKNSQRWYFAWENLQEVFLMFVVVLHSSCFCDVGCCCFYVSGLLFRATGTPPSLPGPVKASTSSELYPGYFWYLHFSVTFLPRVLRFWVGIFYPQAFFTLLSFPTFDTTCFYQRLPWEPAVLPWGFQDLPLRFETQAPPICLFESHSVQQKLLAGRFYLMVTTGWLMKNLPLMGFEPRYVSMSEASWFIYSVTVPYSIWKVIACV